MSFAHLEYLQWLTVVPILVVIYMFRVHIRRQKIREWLGPRSEFLRSSISEKKRVIKTLLGICVLALLFIALAQPQGAVEKMEVKNKGIYILLLIDASNSMLAEDIKPNRLNFMKKEISRLIDLSSGDQIALGVFANSAILAAPFTNDLSAVKSYLNDLSTDHLSNQGTNFERAFHLAGRVFEKIKKNKNELAVQVIVMVSDGENHSKETKKVIKDLIVKKDIRIFTLSVGTKEGGVIPVKDYNGQVKEYKKDMRGHLIITRLEKSSLKNFAKWGKGAYYHITYSGKAIEQLRQDLNHLEKTLFEKTTWTKKEEKYQWFLLLAFLIALMELILSDRSYKKIKWKQQTG